MELVVVKKSNSVTSGAESTNVLVREVLCSSHVQSQPRFSLNCSFFFGVFKNWSKDEDIRR